MFYQIFHWPTQTQITQKLFFQNLKRRPSEEMGGPGSKKFFLAGPWDLEIATNVIMFERPPTLLPHPHPEVEVLRFNYVMKLRQSFQEMCHSREGEFYHSFVALLLIFYKVACSPWVEIRQRRTVYE